MATDTKNPIEKVKEVASSEPVQKVQQEAKPFQQFLQKFNNDGAMTFAGVLAYNLMLAMFPILIALLAILGFTLGQLNPGAVSNIQNQIAGIFPSAAAGDIVKGALAQLNKSSGPLLIIAILTAIFGGSRLFVVIEQFLDLVYHVRPRTLVRQNLVAIGMLLLFVVLIPLMVAASSATAIVVSLSHVIPFLKDNATIATVLSIVGGIVGGILVGFILFLAIYIIMPNQKVSLRHSWRGALVASVLLEVYLFAFPFYASNFLKGYSGVIGGGIILLLFFYYFAVILLLGAEINAFFSENVKPLPNDIFTFVTTTAGRVNQDRPDVEASDHMDARPTEHAVNTRIGKGSGSGKRSGRNNSQSRQSEVRGQDRTSNQKDSQKHSSSNGTSNDSKVSQKAFEKQEQAAAKLRLRQQVKEQKEMAKAPSAPPSASASLVTIVVGALLTVVVELLRFRRHGK